MLIFLYFRPLTKEQLAERYEAAKQRHAERNREVTQDGEKSQDNNEQEKKDDLSSAVQGGEETIRDDKEIFIAFARVFSGTLKKGSKLYVFGPKYDPATKMIVEEDANDR